jgi:hypothetical protein
MFYLRCLAFFDSVAARGAYNAPKGVAKARGTR